MIDGKKCNGCGEFKLMYGFAVNADGEELCGDCMRDEAINQKFMEMEQEEMRLTDEIADIFSDLERARENVKIHEKRLEEAQARYEKHVNAMANFDWGQTPEAE